MMVECLTDTNLLVYAYDPRDAAKAAIARDILGVLADEGLGVLTPQVLGEFFRVVTRKIPSPLTVPEAERAVTAFVRTWAVHDITRWTVLEAVRGVRQHRFPYWDAVIWATARLHQVPVVLSEDFSDGSFVEGVRFLDPFTPGFDLRAVVDSAS